MHQPHSIQPRILRAIQWCIFSKIIWTELWTVHFAKDNWILVLITCGYTIISVQDYGQNTVANFHREDRQCGRNIFVVTLSEWISFVAVYSDEWWWQCALLLFLVKCKNAECCKRCTALNVSTSLIIINHHSIYFIISSPIVLLLAICYRSTFSLFLAADCTSVWLSFRN